MDLSDFASGKVFYNLPGAPAFPVQLACEVFDICFAIRERGADGSRCTVYDPCCGSAYHLGTLAYFRWNKIASIYASDADEGASRVAKRNLSLLTREGLDLRISEIQTMIEKFSKDSHRDALTAALHLKTQLGAALQRHQISTYQFTANVFDEAAINAHLGNIKPDILFSDVPYGQHSQWVIKDTQLRRRETHIWYFLDSLLRYIAPSTVIAVAANKEQKIYHHAYQTIRHLKHGKRHILIMMQKE